MFRRARARLGRIRYGLLELTPVRFVIVLMKELRHDDVSNMAASISYYAFLSLFPIILGLIAILGLFLPNAWLQQQIITFFAQYIPGSTGILQDNITGVIRLRGILGAISVIGLLWSASAVFSVISTGINRAWDIEYQHPFYIKKPLEIAMVLGTGILFLLSLGVTTLFSMVGNLNLPISGTLIAIGTIMLGVLFTFLIFSAFYKYVPITRVSWRHVLPGAFLASGFFEVAKIIFVYYLNHFSNYNRIYGSVSSIIILLIWIYYSAYILLLGAEFSSIFHRFRRDGQLLKHT